jgi:alpha-beta hydrolase superfamily lysophospholipase
LADATERNETHGTFTVEHFTASDGYVIHYRRFRPTTESPLAQMVFLHGIQSHAGWYTHSCERLQQAGFLVDFLDRRGSGMNTHQRGDVTSYDRLTDDVQEYFAGPGARTTLPRFLAGISWGGKTAVAVLHRRHETVDGLLLLCPGFFPRHPMAIKDQVAVGAARLFSPTRYLPIPLNDPALFTSSAHWQEFLRKDKAAIHQATARLLVESRRLDRHIRDAWQSIHVPVLLLLGQHDQIIDNTATRSYVQRFAASDKTIIEYPDAQHTLEFEPNAELFVHDIVSWVREHIPEARVS